MHKHIEVKVLKARTSEPHPLLIAVVNTRTGGRVGMTFCPGKCDLQSMTGAWERDLDTDLRAVADCGASALVTLMEQFELNQAECSQTRPLLWGASTTEPVVTKSKPNILIESFRYARSDISILQG